MTKIGSIEIDESGSGGAFRIDEPPNRQSWAGDWAEISDIELSDDWKISLRKDTNYIVAQSNNRYSRDEILEKAVDAATRGLDIFSITTDYHGDAVGAHRNHALWFGDDNGRQCFRNYNAVPLRSQAQARAKIDGEYPEPTIPTWDESFRYFRLSMMTEDLFDAYRNQFLAVEHTLSDICPPKTNEGENEWMLRAFREAHNKYDLSNFAPKESQPAESIHGFHYQYVRCGMFHSKSNSHRLQPRNQEDYEEVQKALYDLTRIYSRIVREIHDVSPGSSGGLTYVGFEYVMQWMKEENPRILLMDRQRDIESGESFYIPEDADILDAKFSRKHSGEGIMLVESRSDISEISNKEIRQIELVNDTAEETMSAAYTSLDDAIDISGFDIIECIECIQLATGYRQRFV